jgi:hypothetical protein
VQSFLKSHAAGKTGIRLIYLFLALSVLLSFNNDLSYTAQTLNPFSIAAPAPASNPAIEAQAAAKFMARPYQSPHRADCGAGNNTSPHTAIIAQTHGAYSPCTFSIVYNAYTGPDRSFRPVRHAYPRAPPASIA